MAIATNTLEITPIRHQGTVTNRWRINASTADASGCEAVVAAPGAGSELVVRRLMLAVGGAATVTIGCGEESNACKRILLGPLAGSAMAVDLDLGADGLVCDPNTALTIDASGAATVWVYAEGVTRTVEAAGIASSSPSSSPS